MRSIAHFRAKCEYGRLPFSHQVLPKPEIRIDRTNVFRHRREDRRQSQLPENGRLSNDTRAP